MPYFDIDGYAPQWTVGKSAITTGHGQRLLGLTGRVLSHAWLLWDLTDDTWFADAPVLLDFDGEQVELSHQKFTDLSITWNTMSPARQPAWTWGSPDTYVFKLRWRDDAVASLAALTGQRLSEVELLEYAGGDMADGMIGVSFVFPAARVTVVNALDENGLEFGEPSPQYRRA